MSRNGKLIVLVGVVFALIWALRSDSTDKDPNDPSITDGRNHVVNRIWIDKVPNDARDKVNIFVAQANPQFGVFQLTSSYEGDYTVFQWNASKTKLDIVMLQTRKKYRLRARVTRKDCGAFDICMELKGAPRGASKYYSMKDWVIDGEVNLTRVQAFIRTKLLRAH